MKVLFSLLGLVCVLTVSSISLAQEVEEPDAEKVNLYPTMPEGETAVGKDGIVYVAYTEEQNNQIKKTYRDFDIIVVEALKLVVVLEMLDEEVKATRFQLSIIQNENKELWGQISKLRLQNTNLENSITSHKRKVGVAVGVSVLVGIGTGFLAGFATGKTQ